MTTATKTKLTAVPSLAPMTEWEIPAPEAKRLLTHMLAHAAADLARPHLCGVYFDERGYICATDGHRLAALTLDAPLPHSVLVPRKDVEAMVTILGTIKGKFQPPAIFTFATATKTITLTTATMTYVADTTEADKYATFPSWDKVMPAARSMNATGASIISIEPRYLTQAMALCADECDGDAPYLAFGENALDPVVVTALHTGVRAWSRVTHARVVVMPMRIK